jgi:hypothetical protein
MRKVVCVLLALRVVALSPAVLRAAMPTASISPSSGNGWSQTFTVTVSDTSGYQDIRGFNVLFSANFSGTNACWLYVQANSIGADVWLASDNASTWSNVQVSRDGGPDVTVQNSQCSFSGSTTRAYFDGINTMTLIISLTFTSKFAGTKNIFLRAVSNTGSDTGYQIKGSWTVNTSTGGPDFTFAVAPTSLTVTAGRSGTLTVTVTALNGFASQVNCTLSGLPPNTITDYGTTSCPSIQTTSSQSVSFYVEPSSSAPPGTYTLTFTGAGGGLSHTAKVTLIVRSPTAPATSVTPSSGSGLSQTFTFAASSVDGYLDVQGGHVLFNSSLSGTHACWLYIERGGGRLWLASDDASGWNFIYPGTASTIQNSQCSISGSSYKANGSGNTVTVTVDITFTSSFAGTKTIFMEAISMENADSGYEKKGTWTVP